MRRPPWKPLKLLEEAGVEPAEVVPAAMLLDMLGNNHPLFLPLEEEGKGPT